MKMFVYLKKANAQTLILRRDTQYSNSRFDLESKNGQLRERRKFG